MRMTMKRETGTRICDAAGCGNEAERSLNLKQVAATGMELKDPEARNARLCREHYKEYKKLSKSARALDSIH
jgi:hypothetical protein